MLYLKNMMNEERQKKITNCMILYQENSRKDKSAADRK